MDSGFRHDSGKVAGFGIMDGEVSRWDDSSLMAMVFEVLECLAAERSNKQDTTWGN